MTRRRLAIALVMTLAAVALANLATIAIDPAPIGPMPYVERPDDQAGVDMLDELRAEQLADDVEEED